MAAGNRILDGKNLRGAASGLPFLVSHEVEHMENAASPHCTPRSMPSLFPPCLQTLDLTLLTNPDVGTGMRFIHNLPRLLLFCTLLLFNVPWSSIFCSAFGL